MNDSHNFRTIFGQIEDDFVSAGNSFTPQITDTVKNTLRTELRDFVADQLRGMGITMNITDWPQENGFITSIPFCFAELTEIEVLGIDITLTSPIGLISIGLSMYYFPGLNALFSNLGLSTSPGPTIGELGIEFQWITLR